MSEEFDFDDIEKKNLKAFNYLAKNTSSYRNWEDEITAARAMAELTTAILNARKQKLAEEEAANTHHLSGKGL